MIKNVLLSALMIVGATVAAVSCAAVTTLLAESSDQIAFDPRFAATGSMVMIVLAAVIGMFFSVITLVVAGATMPIALGLARRFQLPRPWFDMIGGAIAGLLCAMIALDAFEEWGALTNARRTLIFVGYGMVAGGLLGFFRYLVLSRGPAAPRSAQFAG